MVPSVTTGAQEFDFAKIRWIYFGLLIGMFTSSISQTIVSPAIPRIVSELGGVQYYSWLSTIVMLVSAIITPVSGKLADMFGRKRFYVLGLVVFLFGSILSGAAQTFTWLIVSRAIQGVGMGVLMPLSQTILGDIIPPRQRGKYAGYMGALMGAAQVAGPLIGGIITDLSTWRWLFYVNLPVGLFALFLVIRFMNVPELDIPRRVDYAGITTMTIGVSSALLGISFGGTLGWLDPMVVALLLVGAVFLVAFVWVEGRAAEPIVPLHLFRNSIFTWSVVASCFMNMGLMALIIYTPVYAQGVLGVSATESGLILIPMNVGLFVMGIVIGNLTTRTGRYKSFMVAGVVLMGVATVLMTRLTADSTSLQLTAFTTLFGLGVGMAFQLYVLTVQNAVQRRDLGPATSSLQFFRNVANTLGTAVAGTIMTSQLQSGINWRMTPKARSEAPPGGIDPNVVLNHEALSKLPESVVIILKAALADAMHSIYALLPWLALVVLAATLAIKAIPLRDSLPPLEPEKALDSATMSAADPNTLPLTEEEFRARSTERMMAAHLILLIEQVKRGENEMLRAAVAEYGDGDLQRGLQLLRSTSTMLLAEDPAVIDEHEEFAVELSDRGQKREMLSRDITDELNRIAAQVARHAGPAGPAVKPRLGTSRGIDARALQRAVWMLDTALVADFAERRWNAVDDTDGPEPIIAVDDETPVDRWPVSEATPGEGPDVDDGPDGDEGPAAPEASGR